MTLCIALAFEADAANKEPAYFLDQLALGLRDAPGAVRADLAFAAVSELAAAYAQESRLARREIRQQAGQRKLRRWALAVERLTFDLEELAQTVTAQSSVLIRTGPGNNLYLIVDDKPVVISGPRTEDQAELEARIVSRFCSLQPCRRLLPVLKPLDTEPAPLVNTQTTDTHWRFSEDAGPICSTDDGLVFQFDNASDLRRKREACGRVVAELHHLAVAITQHKSHGTRVVWKAVKIVSLPLGGQHEIYLNSDGDTLDLYVPALAAAPDLFVLLRPWLAAKVNGAHNRTMISDAETLLPPVGFLGQ